MSRLIPVICVLVALAATVRGQIPGNGTDLVPILEVAGPTPLLIINHTQSTIIDTDLTPMPLRVRSFLVQAGATVRLRGSLPFEVVAEDDITILGVLDGSGLSGDGGGAGGPGGFAGGASGLAGSGPAPGLPSTTTPGAGGGGGSGTSGGPGTGPGGGVGGGAVVPGIFQTRITPGSGGAGGALPGGGGGGVVRLHAGRSILVTGRLVVLGGDGGEDAGGAGVDHGGGGGAGGTIELISPRVTVPLTIPCPTCVVSAEGGAGGDGALEDGGAGGCGLVIVRSDQFVGASNVLPPPLVLPFGATMTSSDPVTSLAVRPTMAELPSLVGAQVFLLFSGQALSAGQGIPLGGGTLLIDPADALFDPATSPIYPLLLGQGGVITAGTDVLVGVDFSPLVPILASLGLEEFSIFAQAILVHSGGVVDASDVATLDYIAFD